MQARPEHNEFNGKARKDDEENVENQAQKMSSKEFRQCVSTTESAAHPQSRLPS
jgi:hypothetical protein